MGSIERVGFSMPMAACTLGHRRVIKRVSNKRFELSYDGFATLFTLFAVGDGPAPCLEDLRDYLMLSRKTMLSILSDLEARGLVSKLSDPDDHRKMRLRLTSTGRTLTAEALQAFDEIWETKLCASLPDEEFAHFMASGTIERSVAALRGRDCPLSLPHANRRFYSIDHVVYWRAMSDGWARVARRTGDVTMAEFGILALLDDAGDLPTTSVIDALMVQRSVVSACTRALVARGLVVVSQDGSDGRRTTLSPTRDGRALARRLKRELVSFTQHYDTPSDDSAAIINTWYSRMHANLRACWRELLGE